MDTGQGRTYGGDVSTGDPQPAADSGRPEHGPPGAATPHGHTPYDDPGAGAATPPYVYNPYSNVSYPATYPTYPTDSAPPAGLGPHDLATPTPRPGSVHLALVLLLVSALPYLLVGFLALAAAGEVAAAVPPDQLAQLQQLGVDLEQVVRTVGVVILAVALLFVLLAVFAWTGRGWARALLTAMTAGFALMVVGSIAAASAQGVAVDVANLVVLAGPLVLAIVGLVLMFGAAARAWFSRR